MTHVDSEPKSIRPWTDPIVAEVRAARDAIAARYDYDIDRIATAFIEQAKAVGDKAHRAAETSDRPAVPQTPRAPRRNGC